MQPLRGIVTIGGQEYPVTHTALVLIAPQRSDWSYSLYLHADALATGGGFLMLDHLPLGKVTRLDEFRGACIAFNGDEPDASDSVGSDPCDLETSGWTFPGFEDDDSKNCRFESFQARMEDIGGDRFRVTIRCELSNWANENRLDAEAVFECIAKVGTPPVFDSATKTWKESRP